MQDQSGTYTLRHFKFSLDTTHGRLHNICRNDLLVARLISNEMHSKIKQLIGIRREMNVGKLDDGLLISLWVENYPDRCSLGQRSIFVQKQFFLMKSNNLRNINLKNRIFSHYATSLKSTIDKMNVGPISVWRCKVPFPSSFLRVTQPIYTQQSFSQPLLLL